MPSDSARFHHDSAFIGLFPGEQADSLDVLIGGAGEKDTTITSSFPIAYSIVCSARAKPGGSYSRAWARAYGHFVFAIRIR